MKEIKKNFTDMFAEQYKKHVHEKYVNDVHEKSILNMIETSKK